MLAELQAIPDFAMLAAKFGYTLQEIAANAVALIPLINALPPDSPEVVDFRIVSAKSIKIIWVVMCGSAIIGLITCCFVKGYDLDQALVTDQGFAFGVKRAISERMELGTKLSEPEKLKISVLQNLSAEQKSPRENEWEKLDLFGQRESIKANDSKKFKLSIKEKSEYSQM